MCILSLRAVLACGAAGVLALSSVHAQANPAPGGFDGNGVWRPDPGPGLSAWTLLAGFQDDVLAGPSNIRPQAGAALHLDTQKMREIIEAAPWEDAQTGQVFGAKVMVAMPMPDGTDAVFEIFRTQIMHPELQAQYPQIMTFAGTNRTPGPDYGAPGVFDLTPMGFHAQVRAPSGTILIDPVTQGDIEHYVSYYTRDYKTPAAPGGCGVTTEEQEGAPAPGVSQRRAGPTRRLYDLAVATSAEWTAANGGDVTNGLASVVTMVNRLVGVYLPEASITFQLVANNNLLILTDTNTDGITNSNNGTALGEVTNVINSRINSNSYDIGHLFTTTGGGIATLSGVCGANKARGVSGSVGINDWFTTMTFLHEVGHQFSAGHTFNSPNSNCVGQRSSTSAYEPGGGSTIMAYPVQCGADSFVSQADFYFHSDSFDRIIAFVAAGGACSTNSATGNVAPVFSALTNRSAPLNTPFELTGSATDSNGDAMTFNWEQRSLGPALALSAGDNGSSPIIRSRPAGSSSTRSIPILSNLLSNTLAPAELLPTVARTITFRATARDNRVDGGGVNTADVNISFVNTGAPFAVTFPNGAETLPAGSNANVTWNVAGTSAPPISTSQVRIRLSTDGGNTFPTLLGTFSNSGSATVAVPPGLNTSAARIRVEAVDNVFFDISNATFTIRPPAILSGTGKQSIIDNTGNGNSNGRVDPGEDSIGLVIRIRNDGGGTATGVTGTITSLTPTATVVTGSASWPDMGPGVIAENLASPFVISVSPSHVCGDPISLSLSVNSAQGGGATIPITVGTGGANQPYSFVWSGATAIPDGNFTGVEIPLEVSGLGGVISTVRLNIDGTVCSIDPNATTVGISHALVSDLIITLIAPDGMSSVMVNRPGGLANLGNNFCNTLFLDDNAVPILSPAATTALAPYTGNWRPVQAMSRFQNRNPNGQWRLRVVDAAAGNTGTVRGFTLTIITQGVSCDPPLGAACNIADITEVGGTSELPGQPDGQLTVDDVILFVNLFSDSQGCPGAAPCNRADITAIGGGGQPADGQLTVDDVIEFFNVFSDGCS